MGGPLAVAFGVGGGVDAGRGHTRLPSGRGAGAQDCVVVDWGVCGGVCAAGLSEGGVVSDLSCERTLAAKRPNAQEDMNCGTILARAESIKYLLFCSSIAATGAGIRHEN